MSELPIRLHPPKISGSDWNNLVTYGLILTGDSWPVDYTSGQIFYRTDLNNFYYYNGALWKEIGFVTGSTTNLDNIVADTVEVLDLLTVDGKQVFKDTGNIIVITGSNHWVVPKPGYTPTNNYLYLYATMISPADRTTEITDPVLCTNQAFFVEKDTYTHGFLGTASDPYKAMGGGALLMGQGFTGRYCPPLFDLTGTIVDMDDPLGGYASGSSFPAAENYAWFYRTDEETLYQYTSSTWNSMFTNVKSSEYDTLFLIRADTSGPANLYLNNLNVNTIYPQANSWVTIDEKLLLNGNFQIANGWVVSSLNPSGSGLGIGSPTEQWSGSCVQVMFTDDITALNNAWVDINNKLVVHGNFQITDGWVVSSLNPSGSNLALGSATEQWSGSCVQGMYTDDIHALNNDWVDINNKLVVHGNFQISDGWVVSSLNPSGSGLGIGSPSEQWSGSCIQGIYTDDISALNNSWVDINDKLVVHGDFQISDGWVVSSLNPSGSVGLGSATEKWTGIVATTGYFDAIEMSGSNMTIKYTGSYIGFRNGQSRLYSNENGVIQVQDVSGSLATLDASNVFVDHINSATNSGIFLLDHLRFYDGVSGVSLYDSTNSTGSSGNILVVNSSGLPVWSGSGGGQWTAGTVSSVTTPLYINSNSLKIYTASTSTSGSLTATDWNTFNNKYGSGSTAILNGITLRNGGYSAGISVNASHVIEIGDLPVQINKATTVGDGTNGLSVSGNTGITGVLNVDKLTLSGSYGDVGQVLTSQGDDTAPIWSTPSTWNGGTVTGATTFTNTVDLQNILRIVRANTSSSYIENKVTGDTYPRIKLIDDYIAFGDGSASPTLTLGYSTTDGAHLHLNGAFQVDGATGLAALNVSGLVGLNNLVTVKKASAGVGHIDFKVGTETYPRLRIIDNYFAFGTGAASPTLTLSYQTSPKVRLEISGNFQVVGDTNLNALSVSGIAGFSNTVDIQKFAINENVGEPGQVIKSTGQGTIEWGDADEFDGGEVNDLIRVTRTSSSLGHLECKLFGDSYARLKLIDDYIAFGDGTISPPVTLGYSSTGGVHLHLDGDMQIDGDLGVTGLNVTNNLGVTGTFNVNELTINSNAGSSGQVLTSQGSGSAPIWSTPSSNWDGGTVTGSDINILKNDPALRLIKPDDSGLFVFISANGVNYIESGLSGSSDSKAPIRFTSMLAGTTWMVITTDGQIQIPSIGANTGLSIGSYLRMGNTSYLNAPFIAFNADLTSSSFSSGTNLFTPIYKGDSGASMGALWANAGTGELEYRIYKHGTSASAVNWSSFTQIFFIDDSGQFQLPRTGSSGGLLIGGDVQLYRSAENTLTIPDYVNIEPTSGNAQLNINCASGYDSVLNFQYASSTKLAMGYDGSNTYFTVSSDSGNNNFNFVNNSGSINFTSSSGKIYTVGGLQICPNSGGSGQIGNSIEYYHASYVDNVYGKHNGLFGCERSKSGQEWSHEYTTEFDALEYLTHELTKTKFHITYDQKDDKKIICTCGKSVENPCPEHIDEWNDKYTVNTGKITQATGLVVLEQSAKIAKLEMEIVSLKEQIKNTSG